MDTHTEQYIYELEQALEKLLEFFEVSGADTYIVEDVCGELFAINNDMAIAVDRAMDVMYGESGE